MPRPQQTTLSSFSAFQGVDRALPQESTEARIRRLAARMSARDRFLQSQTAEIDDLYRQYSDAMVAQFSVAASENEIVYSEGAEQPRQPPPGQPPMAPLDSGCDCDECRSYRGKKPLKKKVKKISKRLQCKIDRTVMTCQALL